MFYLYTSMYIYIYTHLIFSKDELVVPCDFPWPSELITDITPSTVRLELEPGYKEKLETWRPRVGIWITMHGNNHRNRNRSINSIER